MKRASLVLALLLMAACGSGDQPSNSQQPTTLTVFAASSLTDAFTEMGKAYEGHHRGAEVRFNFLSSSDLATQIEEGAHADVFASADTSTMDRLAEEGLVEDHPTFARNSLAIVVPTDNPGNIGALKDLENDDLVVAVCNPECPAGKYATKLFSRAGIKVHPDSLEADVRGVLNRVALGEADAGIVYLTDVVAAARDVTTIAIPEQDNVVVSYPIAVTKDAVDGASDFVDLVLSDEGRSILAEHGFMLPS